MFLIAKESEATNDETADESGKETSKPRNKIVSPRNEFVDQSKLIGSKVVNNRKVHICEKCGLEFTSTNSVVRHQEKSCLRVRVISLDSSPSSSPLGKKEEAVTKKKCPICSSVFYNTHRLSIHIYKHHKNLLGSALQPPTKEARRLNEKQLAKMRLAPDNANQSDDENGSHEHEEDEEHIEMETTENKVCIRCYIKLILIKYFFIKSSLYSN